MPASPDTGRRYAGIAATAEYLQVDPKTVRRMIARGEIRGYRVGPRLVRLDLNEIDAAARVIPTTTQAVA